MCEKLDVPVKGLHSRILPDGWKFYFAAPTESPTTATRFVPDLSGLRLVSPDGSEKCLSESVMKKAPGIAGIEAIREFCYEDLGITIHRTRDDHDLIGQSYYNSWLDVRGTQKEIYGTITECLETLEKEPTLFFKVNYREAYRTLLNGAATIEDDIPMVDTVNEAVATGGHIAFLEKSGSNVSFDSRSPPAKYIVPTTRLLDGNGFKILHGGVQLEVESMTSGIEGAGQGLFLRATCIERAGWAGLPVAFILKPGERIDLGVYGPLRKADRKAFHVQAVKNFIFEQKPHIYMFDSKCINHDSIDVTDDKSGELHELALENILVRANETDGVSEPTSIIADHDPQGSLHYFLGNEESGLRLPFGVWIELKVGLCRVTSLL